MSRKKPPGPALTMEESVPEDSGLTEVTNPPPSLLTLTSKKRGFVLSVVVTRNDSPVMLKTGDCLSPEPLVLFTTLAPAHSESAPVVAVVPVVVPVVPVVLLVVVPVVVPGVLAPVVVPVVVPVVPVVLRGGTRGRTRRSCGRTCCGGARRRARRRARRAARAEGSLAVAQGPVVAVYGLDHVEA